MPHYQRERPDPLGSPGTHVAARVASLVAHAASRAGRLLLDRAARQPCPLTSERSARDREPFGHAVGWPGPLDALGSRNAARVVPHGRRLARGAGSVARAGRQAGGEVGGEI